MVFHWKLMTGLVLTPLWGWPINPLLASCVDTYVETHVGPLPTAADRPGNSDFGLLVQFCMFWVQS